MRKFFTHTGVLLILLSAPIFLQAQLSEDYSLALQSGKIVPAQNATSLTKSSTVFTQSRFDDIAYVTIQFYTLPTEGQKEQLKQAGIELLDYIPHLAFTAAVDQRFTNDLVSRFGIRSIIQFTPAQKTVPDLLAKSVPAYARKNAGFADVDIVLYKNLSEGKIASAVASLGASVIQYTGAFRMVTVRVPENNIPQLVALPFVQWAEYIAPPNVPENLPGRSLHRTSVLNDGVRNLKGDGMNIGVWDEIASQHLDFSPAGRLINVETGGAGSHGTHVSGTVGSRGLINPNARGMAPNATIYSYNGFNNDVQVEMATAIPANTLISSNHSYHDGLGVQCGVTGASVAYSLRARNTDINLNNFNYHLHCHSAGNAQTSCASGWGTITGTGKAAKNNLVVASITSLEGMTGYSSFGPVHDGRVKPEISAMGDGVFSTYTPLNTYGTISGTSMSTPGVTGTVAVLAQRYKQLNGNVLPPSMLIKNVVCNTAQDLGNAGPDYRFGFGRINALAAVRILEENRYQLNTVATGATNDFNITVPAGASRLRVMLTWNDPAAAANAATALVNNLDLRVINGPTTSLPWILDPLNPSLAATKADDNISNIEQVTIDNPPAGTYTLRVTGEAVPSGPTQAYSLTWDINQPYIEVIYPNGGESFTPSGSQVITWDNSGITGTQTVQYSLDNGGTWTNISTSVAANTTRLTWTVPAGVNTSQALIRVFSGAITDNSDATFKILGTVSGFSGSGVSCNAGEVLFTWTAVTNATHYDIYRLDPATGNFVLLGNNITGTTYTATGLTPNTSMWFTIRAKNNTTLSESERAVAINVTSSNGGGGLGAVGTITGLTSVCGSQTGVTYTIAAVAGATSYTWTVPAGVAITGGQGTTTLTVNINAGTTGTISVFASNGTCQTAPNNLAITSGNAGAAPTSGGNQLQNVCPAGVVPTLTATATPAAGFTIVWYNAATNGTVVTSPTLSTVGTITYYAASRETSSGCESATRTPVTLTINAVPAATASAGGPTSFCQGGNVVLTANAGSSYLWSDGATSQSITVNTSGSYTVTVTNGSCVSTSSAIAVNVNPLPVANVTAGGALAFCQGGNVVLSASAGSSYLWSNGATTPTITVSNSGNYSVTVTNASGCAATSASTVVAVSPNPQVTISASPYTRLYPGLTTTLTANVTPAGTYNYAWFRNGNTVPGATGPTLTGIDLDKLGSYTVTVTNTSGLPCSNTSAAVSILDSARYKLFIMPNPNGGVFDVAYYSPAATSYTLSLYDGKGALVFTKAYTINAPYQRMNVNIKQHGRGIYQLVLTDKSGKRIANGKVLIQ
ncbi:MAG: S8 family serine peptidase [Bacteroidetes bacterium]|nr:S8 family serine peptidase [Bacteroidota bacterium]